MDLGNNKRIVNNIFIFCMLILGLVLIWIMNKLGVVVTPDYVPEEDIYAIPFNIGFQMPVVLGMVGSLLLQSAIYCMMFCQKEWKLFVLATGVWINFTMVPWEIIDNSAIYIKISLRERGFTGIWFREVFKNLRYFGCIFLVIVGLIALYHWFIGTTINEENKKKRLLRIVTAIFVGVVGVIILGLFSFTNIWYIGLCLVTGVLVLLLMKCLERYWAKYDFIPRNTKYRVLEEDLDTEDIEFDLPENKDEREMGLQVMDSLVDFAEELDKMTIDEKDKKEHLIYMIKKYHSYLEVYYSEKK